MDAGTVFSRTPKGEEEVTSRKYGLPMAVRRVLILVDGKSPLERLLQSVHGVGNGSAVVDDLLRAGFIQTGPGNPVLTANGPSSAKSGLKDVMAVKEALVQAALDVLGEDAPRIVEKIREAPTDRGGLMASLQNCKKVVKLTISESKAKILEQKCEEIIGRF
ncbi:MAG: hypothetical protein ACWGSD_11375 [Thermodesulfobacteriota bacterium]